jgi:hypothetical protein
MPNWMVKGEGDMLMLGVAEIGSDEPGEPVPIAITNTSDWTMSSISVGAQGEGRDLLQFAADKDGAPGVWAAAGEEVTPGVRIAPDQSFVIWARVLPPAEHDPGRVPFQINIKGLAVA